MIVVLCVGGGFICYVKLRVLGKLGKYFVVLLLVLFPLFYRLQKI